jgi:acetate kinase
MNILVVNAGSTSLKVDAFAMPAEQCLASVSVEGIGQSEARLKAAFDGTEEARELSIADHDTALRRVLDLVLDRIAVDAVGHRIVHGGESLTAPTRIDDRVMAVVEDCARFAPLHNPANLAGVRAARARLPRVPQVAVMDTGFHRTLAASAYLYGLPYELYERHGVRRYGFHGTSHQYVAVEAARLMEKPLAELRLITCHLGGGASVCAIDGGRSVDTSMGMTPLEGLVMGTRCGDVDAGVVLFLQERLGMTAPQIDSLLNRESGLLGLSGISRDMRELLAAAASGERRAGLAIDVFCRRVRRYIGAYLAELSGADAVVFTGGIGENSPPIRAAIAAPLGGLGIELDAHANSVATRTPRVVSSAASDIAVLVVPTDEELQIARDVHELMGAATQQT